MALQHVIGFIDSISDSNNEVNFVFAKIRSFLEELENKNEEDIELLKQIIIYLESSVRLTSYSYLFFSSSQSLGGFLNSKKQPLLFPRPESLDDKDKKDHDALSLPDTYSEHLTYIHTELLKYYRFLEGVHDRETWRCSYPLVGESRKEVMNEVVATYQIDQTIIKIGSEKNAMGDHIRNTGFVGKKLKTTEEQLESDLDQFVDKYAEAYPPDERSLVKAWLKAKGGQGNDSIVNDLFMSQEFSESVHGLHITKSLERFWYFDENTQKFCLSMDLLVNALTEPDSATPYKYLNPHVSRNEPQLEAMVALTEPTFAKEAFNLEANELNPSTLDPMMRVWMKIELNIKVNDANQKFVQPEITELQTFCYTKSLYLNHFIDRLDYEAEDKALVKKWVQAHSGRDDNSFINDIAASQEFRNMFVNQDIFNKQFILGAPHAFRKRWYVENNKLCLDCKVFVYTLSTNDKLILLNPRIGKHDKHVDAAVDFADAQLAKESFDLQVLDHSVLAPIMCIEASMELDIDANKKVIVPKIKELNVQSYTERFQVKNNADVPQSTLSMRKNS